MACGTTLFRAKGEAKGEEVINLLHLYLLIKGLDLIISLILFFLSYLH